MFKKVVKLDKDICNKWISSKHYRRTLGIFWEGFGLIDENYNLCGVICYGQPSAPIQKHAFTERDFRLYELTRLVIQSNDDNAASFLVSNSLKMLREKPCAIVSYADGAQGHVGIVYQATNWIYTGEVKAHDCLYVVDGQKLHPTTIRDRYGVTSPVEWARQNNVEMIKPQGKHRYFYIIGNKTQKKKMLKKLKYEIVEKYPKADPKRYDDGPRIEQKITNLFTYM